MIKRSGCRAGGPDSELEEWEVWWSVASGERSVGLSRRCGGEWCVVRSGRGAVERGAW